MSAVKIIIVEDEAITAMQITRSLEELGYEVLDEANCYNEAIELLQTQQPDIAILDINLMGEKSGIDIAKVIKAEYKIPFIFLTSLSDKATVDAAKQVQPNAYLMKPFTKEHLYTSIEIALSNFNNKPTSDQTNTSNDKLVVNNAFFVKTNKSFKKVPFHTITHLRSDHVYIELNTVDSRKYLIRSSMQQIEEMLPPEFIRVHRSYIANVKFAERLTSNELVLVNESIPVSKSYSSSIKTAINIKY